MWSWIALMLLLCGIFGLVWYELRPCQHKHKDRRRVSQVWGETRSAPVPVANVYVLQCRRCGKTFGDPIVERTPVAVQHSMESFSGGGSDD